MDVAPPPVGVTVVETTPARTRELKIPLISGIGAEGAEEWHRLSGEGKALLRLEAAEAELDEGWLRLEHFCELDIASD